MSSSRGGHRRRDRSWERDDRDRDRDRNRERYESSRGGRGSHNERRRSSRSRSPRRGDRDRDRERDRDGDRRDRRDRDHDHRRDDDRSDRRDDRRRDDRRETTRKDDKLTSNRNENHPRDVEMKARADSSSHPDPPKGSSMSSARPSVDPNTPEHIHEDGEAVDDDAGMMEAMGLAGFGSTKGKHVEGNQEGGTNVKKIRTWRQYMNRRGGFNRPLDKIK